MTEPRKTPLTDAAWLEHISTVSRDTVGFREHARALEIETQELAEVLEGIVRLGPDWPKWDGDDLYTESVLLARAALARHRAKQEGGT